MRAILISAVLGLSACAGNGQEQDQIRAEIACKGEPTREAQYNCMAAAANYRRASAPALLPSQMTPIQPLPTYPIQAGGGVRQTTLLADR